MRTLVILSFVNPRIIKTFQQYARTEGDEAEGLEFPSRCSDETSLLRMKIKNFSKDIKELFRG